MRGCSVANTPIGYYEWYPRDFYTSIVVRSMSFTARSIYRELLDIQWENGCLTDVERLLNVMGVTVEQWNEFAPFLDELFPNGVNNRLNLLREKAFQSQEKKAAAGRASAQKRLETNTCSTPVQQVFNQTETETTTETETKKSKFVKPTVEEITSYMEERNWLVPDGQKFFDSYESKGWKIGKAQMKDWKATVRTWEGYDWFKGKREPSSSVPTSLHGPGFGIHWGYDPDGNKEAYDEIGAKMIAEVAA